MPSSRTLGSGWQQSSISSWNLPGRGQGQGAQTVIHTRLTRSQLERGSQLESATPCCRHPYKPADEHAACQAGTAGTVPHGLSPAPGPLPRAPRVNVERVERHGQRGEAAVGRLILQARTTGAAGSGGMQVELSTATGSWVGSQPCCRGTCATCAVAQASRCAACATACDAAQQQQGGRHGIAAAQVKKA